MVCETTTFGLKAEGWIIELLVAEGYRVIRATEEDDKIHKVDFWVVWRKNRWLAIQFSINRDEMLNGKGLDALRRGICPSWLDGQELEKATNGHPELRPCLVAQFRGQAEAIVAAHPELVVRRPVVTALYNSIIGGTKVLAGVR